MNNWISFQCQLNNPHHGGSRQIGCPKLVLLVLTTMKIISVIKCDATFVCAYCQVDFLYYCLFFCFRQFPEESHIREWEKYFLQSLLVRVESNNFVLPVSNHLFVCVLINNKQNIPVIVYYCLKFDMLFLFPVHWVENHFGLPNKPQLREIFILAIVWLWCDYLNKENKMMKN